LSSLPDNGENVNPQRRSYKHFCKSPVPKAYIASNHVDFKDRQTATTRVEKDQEKFMKMMENSNKTQLSSLRTQFIKRL